MYSRQFKRFICLALSAFLVFSLAGCQSGSGAGSNTTQASATSSELPTVNWKMTDDCGPGTIMWDADQITPRIMSELTGGRFTIEAFAPGAIVPAMELFDAVANGTVECGSEWGCNWAGKNTAFAALNSMCFSLDAWQFMDWYYQGGGKELGHDLWAKYDMEWFPIWGYGSEQGFITSKPIKSLNDFKGLKLRCSEPVTRAVLERIGASPVMMAVGEVFEALERGVVDGLECATPYVNYQMNLHECTQYWSTPIWHQTSGVRGLAVNKKAYDALPSEYQIMLKYACQASHIEGMTLQDAMAAEGTRLFLESGMKRTKLSDADMATLKKYAEEEKQKFAAENPDFKAILDSQNAFAENYKCWQDSMNGIND